MLSLEPQDYQQLQQKGISEAQLQEELEDFANGFPYLKLYAPASVQSGILQISEEGQNELAKDWDDYLAQEDHKVCKFVPASGAASRMFKNLFAFLDADYVVPQTDFENLFFVHLSDFAFFDALDAACQKLFQASASVLREQGRFKDIVRALLNEEGLNYGQLPKGLLQFHRYENGVRTPLEEHLVEGALYARDKKDEVHLHITVSHSHKELFQNLLDQKLPEYEARFGVKYSITMSEQKPSTDTVAVTPDNQLFRQDDGSILFRPGGHGSLIENLNELDSDIVFIKNIDNVVPDRLKEPTVRFKKVLAGHLVNLQHKAFHVLQRLESRSCSHEELQGYLRSLETEFCCTNPAAREMDDAQLGMYMHKKFNRPMRVCAMVRNQGEPGGGPFLVCNRDNSVSCQILESAQINMEDADAQSMFKSGTHFNPVDLACALRDYRGEKFDLLRFVDKTTGFISSKSKNGRDLKALERPGLWNGAMSDWLTVFIEVPLETFNPVKTVNDLLRPQHQ